jgi:hypothetical protein
MLVPLADVVAKLPRKSKEERKVRCTLTLHRAVTSASD